MFKDEADIRLKAGNGGEGAVSFLRLKYIPRGGPDGGDGGDGGNIIFRGKTNLKTLNFFHTHKIFHAQNGRSGSGALRKGHNGENLIINVPLGTQIYCGERQMEILKEEDILYLKGGRGGKGNKSVTTSIRQAPYETVPAERTLEYQVHLKLKMLGDVGIIGMPNAGKSSFINSISNAKSKVGNYAFTTLEPQPGIWKEIVFVDIPGIIEGASHNKGLGFKFLAHVERCRLLLFLLDANQEPMKALNILRKEIQNFGTCNQQYIIALNKIDLISSTLISELKNQFPQAFLISVATKNFGRLLYEIEDRLKNIDEVGRLKT